jgi:uncharacterized protein YabN with tetrapyrrole methylase and pyrophosphatase domain
MSSLKD